MNYDAILTVVDLLVKNLENQLVLVKENLKVTKHFQERIKELKEDENVK